MVGGAAPRGGQIWRRVSPLWFDGSNPTSGRAVPRSRPNESSHLSSIRNQNTAAGRVARTSDAPGNRDRDLLSARAPRAGMLSLARLLGRQFSGIRTGRARDAGAADLS